MSLMSLSFFWSYMPSPGQPSEILGGADRQDIIFVVWNFKSLRWTGSGEIGPH